MKRLAVRCAAASASRTPVPARGSVGEAIDIMRCAAPAGAGASAEGIVRGCPGGDRRERERS